MISYLIRYNWAYINGAIEHKEEFRGLAYDDMVDIPLDEIEEQVLTLCKEFNMSYEYLQNKVPYTDIGVLYAKYANTKAFQSYNDFISLPEEQKSKHIRDWGEIKPYAYQLVTVDKQKEMLEEAQKTELQKMYKNGGSLNG